MNATLKHLLVAGTAALGLITATSAVGLADGLYDKATGRTIHWRKFDIDADITGEGASGPLPRFVRTSLTDP